MRIKYFRIFFMTIIIYVFAAEVFSQTIFNRIYGGPGREEAHSIKQTFDGGYIFTGLTNTYTNGLQDIWLVKLDSAGDTVWTKNYGFNLVEEGFKILQLPDSGFVILGRSTTSSGGLYDDFWLIRTNVNGDTLWTKFYGDQWQHETPSNIIQTNDNGFALIGFDQDYVDNGSIWFIKTNANGDTLWTQKYGGPYSEGASGIIQTTDNGYLIGGTINRSFSSNYDLYLVKTDSLGDTLWTRDYGYINSDGATAIIPTPDNGYFIAGYKDHYYNGFSYDIWLLKINAFGDSLWSKYYGNDEDEYPTSIHPTNDGNYMIGGRIGVGDVTTDGLFLVKFDSNGDTIWTRRYGGDSNDWGTDAKPTNDGGYILAGYTNSFGAQGRDAWIIKTDSNGDPSSISQNNTNYPKEFVLFQNYPNPFNPVTTIKYNLSIASNVTLEIFNLLGQNIKTLVNEKQSARDHQIQWDGTNHFSEQVTSGVYIYRLSVKALNGSEHFVQNRKMILLR